MIYDFFSQTYAYLQACIDNLKTRPPLVLFLLFAPALLFDTVRYYVANTIVFFLSIFKENRPEQEPLTTYSPMVTALVPVFNEGKRIKHTLDAVLESDYPNLEIKIDIRSSKINFNDTDYSLNIPDSSRSALLAGTWDSTASLLKSKKLIISMSENLPYISGFLKNT